LPSVGPAGRWDLPDRASATEAGVIRGPSFAFDFSRPGKHTDNAVIESFNGRLRDECLNQHWFLSLDEARAVTEAWKEDYSRFRPHGALGNRTASEFARPLSGYAQITAIHG
jgi:hypothetical protein